MLDAVGNLAEPNGFWFKTELWCQAALVGKWGFEPELRSLNLNYKGLLEALKALQLSSSDLSESQPVASNYSVGDDDIEGNHPIQTDTRYRPAFGSKCVSRS
jgi:hypothetical protein